MRQNIETAILGMYSAMAPCCGGTSGKWAC